MADPNDIAADATQPVQFALAPALVGIEQPMDYSTRAGQNLYASAIAELPYCFTGREASLPAFLQAIRDRSTQAGWNNIFSITIGQDNAGNNINRDLLIQYGEITLENVRNDATNDYIGQPVRNAQVSHQIYQCLKKSISDNVAVASPVLGAFSVEKSLTKVES